MNREDHLEDAVRAFGLGQEFTPQQRAALSAWMDRIYDNFVARVSRVTRNVMAAAIREK